MPRVSDVAKRHGGFRVATSDGDAMAARVVLATGGRSLPKSGSDGAGFEIARRLGHTLVSTTPALVPLLLEAGQHAMHRELSGVAHDAELTLWTDGAVEIRLRGSLLWTHFGISGPVTLDMSRHWLRAALEGRRASLTLSFCPGVHVRGHRSLVDCARKRTSAHVGRDAARGTCPGLRRGRARRTGCTSPAT